MIGSAARVSWCKKKANTAMPPSSGTRVSTSDHPFDPASTRPSTTPPTPMVQVIAPRRSKWPFRRSVSWSTTRPTSHTVMPIGTLTNMTQRHETHWVSSPPSTRPVAPPAAETVV